MSKKMATLALVLMATGMLLLLVPTPAAAQEADGVNNASAEHTLITTDGAPMNELVRPEHGVLVACARTQPKDLATAYFVDRDALEAAVERVHAMSDEEFTAMGRHARAFYLAERQAFLGRFAEAWDSVAA